MISNGKVCKKRNRLNLTYSSLLTTRNKEEKSVQQALVVGRGYLFAHFRFRFVPKAHKSVCHSTVLDTFHLTNTLVDLVPWPCYMRWIVRSIRIRFTAGFHLNWAVAPFSLYTHTQTYAWRGRRKGRKRYFNVIVSGLRACSCKRVSTMPFSKMFENMTEKRFKKTKEIFV